MDFILLMDYTVQLHHILRLITKFKVFSAVHSAEKRSAWPSDYYSCSSFTVYL